MDTTDKSQPTTRSETSSTADSPEKARRPTALDLVQKSSPEFLDPNYKVPEVRKREQGPRTRRLAKALIENAKRNLREGHETS